MTTYRTAWRHFNHMCRSVFGWAFTLPLPVSYVCFFVTYMHMHLSLVPSTIATYLSAISFVHKINNYPDPCDNFVVHNLVSGVSRLDTDNKQTRLPITLPILHKLICALEVLEPVIYKQYMYKSMFLFSFHACCRVGELTKSGPAQHWLKYQNIVFNPGSFTVTFTSFKHKAPGHSPKLTVHSQNDMFCPVKALQLYISFRGHHPGPLFCLSDNQPIHRSQLSKMLNNCLSFLQINTSRLTSHSFRVGRATLGLEQGMTLQQLLMLGRWKSMSALTKYLKPEYLHV